MALHASLAVVADSAAPAAVAAVVVVVVVVAFADSRNLLASPIPLGGC